MFSRIIRRSLPISGICKSCNKNQLRLQKNSQLDLRLVSINRRHINTYYSQFSQHNPKEKPTEQDNENNDNNNNKKQNEPKEESSQKKDEEQTSEKSDDKKSDQKKRPKDTIFGKDIVLHSFENARKKEKETFLECLRMYESQPGRKRERVPFIYAALKYMEEFGVHKDLTVYKKILDIFPKEKMIPTNQFQTMFMHYPKEQYCAVAVLEQMEDNGVIPDCEMELTLLNVFGKHGMPLEKYWKMMYWMPKFRNINPWPLPKPIPDEPFELAKLAMIKISSIDVESSVTIFDSNDVEDSIDKTWIVSAMAPKQSELLLKHNKKTPIYVEGPFQIYVATKSVDYFFLRADPLLDRKYPEYDPDAVDKIKNPYLERYKKSDLILPPCIHEQVDWTIFANCATGTSTKDSLLSWIRCLQIENPVLGEIPIVFTLRNYSEDRAYLEDGTNKQVPGDESSKDPNDKLLQ